MTTTTIMVVGVGSIGGAVAHALAAYGVGHLILVDYDRLRWHNLVRHVSGAAHVGRLKVSAVREDLQVLRPETKVTALPLDVVTDADQIRALLAGFGHRGGRNRRGLGPTGDQPPRPTSQTRRHPRVRAGRRRHRRTAAPAALA
ncbi:ThiF family adenylyltransferase [Micromonospora sp. CPCC 206061]|uniref:ThiF family adenylyltransferase n=1 Tax=Micromonospora sp. CPCC 206061 TaxID=3122410 RepID=UPI003FA5B0D4